MAGDDINVTSATSSSGGSCTESNNTVTCSIGTLAVSASDTVVIVATLDSPGTVTNDTTVAANEAEPNLVDNATTISITAGSIFDVNNSTTSGSGSTGPWFLVALTLWSLIILRRDRKRYPASFST